MKIRNKLTGQIHEVLPGTLYAENIFEEVKDEEIKVGEPKVEYEIEEEPGKSVKKSTKKPGKNVKKQGKGEKKNGSTKTKSN